MADFIQAFQKLILNEGIYSNDLDDSGGRTVLGISENNWPNWEGWKIVNQLSTVKEMATNEELQRLVRVFYLNNFWNPILGDKIESQKIANSIFDFGVNAGSGTSMELAQKTVGVYVDGKNGNNTLKALNEFDERLFVAEFALNKIERYCDIVDKKPTQLRFLKGWCRRSLKR